MLHITSLGYLITGLFVPFFLLLLISYYLKSYSLDKIVFGYLLIVNALYWYWRLRYTIPEFSFHYLWAWIFFVSETIMIYLFCFTGYLLSLVNKNSSHPIQSENNPSPKIDIFIPTYNESIDLLEKTIYCALNIDYSNYAIWILDNGNRPTVKQLCEKYKINYLDRVNHVNSKAGNLNNALEKTKNITHSEFFLVIDSDFLCRKDILKKLLVPFYQGNDKIAIVQAPQYFYNADPLQNSFRAKAELSDEQRLFFDVMSPAMDKINTATCCGSPFLARRDIVEKVGGFPTNTLTEDINLTYLLYGHDYITRYLKEPLACGMAAENIDQYISQRKRWTIGYIQQCFSKLGPLFFNQQSFLQRGFLLAGLSAWFSYVFRIIFLLAPILNLFFGIKTIDVSDNSWLLFIPVYVLSNLAFLYLKSKKTYVPVITDALHFAIAIPLVVAILRSLRKVTKLRFDVTEKELTLTKTRANYKVLLPVLFFILAYVIGISLNFIFCPTFLCWQNHLAGIVWGIINIIFLLFSLAIGFDRDHRKDLWLTNANAILHQDNREISAPIKGISLSLCQLVLKNTSLRIGGSVKINVAEILIAAKVTEIQKNWVEFTFTDQSHQTALLKYFFSEGHIKITEQSKPLKIFTKLV